MTSEMSITQGLAELKLLDKRIKKLCGTDCFKFVDVSTKTRFVDTDTLKKEALASYQSFVDLVKRRDSIKQAIVLKNATTLVKIGEWTGSIAEAIERKSSIEYKKSLLYNMKRQATAANERYDNEQRELADRLDRLMNSEMGKDVRTNPETINAITSSFYEKNKVSLVDPLNSAKLIADLEEEVETFLTNVDWVLSETNGKTRIRVGAITTTNMPNTEVMAPGYDYSSGVRIE
jgi:hypothetical protein